MPWIAQSTAEICFKAKESTRLARLFVYRHHVEKLLGGSKKLKQAKARGSCDFNAYHAYPEHNVFFNLTW